jgi:hypothetical protein
MEVKKQKSEVKKQYTRKREGDEDDGDYKMYKRRSTLGYFQNACELLANNEKMLYEILESIVYEWDRFKKRTKLEVSLGHGQMKWADKYLNTYYTITKVINYYLGLIGDKNINLRTNENY